MNLTRDTQPKHYASIYYQQLLIELLMYIPRNCHKYCQNMINILVIVNTKSDSRFQE